MRAVFITTLLVLLLHAGGYGAIITVPGDFSTIQGAVDAAQNFDMIQVAAGTYVEQVFVDGKVLEIRGQGPGNTHIRSPSILNTSFVTDAANHCIVAAVNGASLTLRGLSVDGNLQGNFNYRFIGAGFHNAKGTLKFCRVVNIQDSPLSGTPHGIGVYSHNDTSPAHEILIDSTVLLDYQMAGAVASGPYNYCHINYCTFEGLGRTPIAAQTGIQISDGADGLIENTSISGHCFTGSSWVANGILLNEGGVVDIRNCSSITDNQMGAYFITTDGSFINNTVTAGVAAQGNDGSFFGLAVDDFCNRTAPPRCFAKTRNTNKAATGTSVTVANSSFISDGTGDGLGVGAWAASLDSVKVDIIGCEVKDWRWGIEAWDDGTAQPWVTVYNCLIQNNINYGLINYSANPVMAEFNDWGAASGPHHSTLNPTGLGDWASGNMDIAPWLDGTETFFADTNILSVSTGGIVEFSLEAGAANAGRYYLIMASLNGWEPGTPLPGGEILPVNWDGFTSFVLDRVNTSVFVNFLSALDGTGSAEAQVNTPALSPSRIGKTMTFAYYLEQNPHYDFTSNPVHVKFIP